MSGTILPSASGLLIGRGRCRGRLVDSRARSRSCRASPASSACLGGSTTPREWRSPSTTAPIRRGPRRCSRRSTRRTRRRPSSSAASRWSGIPRWPGEIAAAGHTHRAARLPAPEHAAPRPPDLRGGPGAGHRRDRGRGGSAPGPLPPAVRDLQLSGDGRGERQGSSVTALVALGPRLAGESAAREDRGRGDRGAARRATSCCSTTPTTTASPAAGAGRWRRCPGSWRGSRSAGLRPVSA